MPAPTSDALIRLYLAARYDVRLAGGRRVSLRIGAHVPSALRDWYGKEGEAAVITACNPHSQPLDARSNRERLRRLLDDLDRLHATRLPAVGRIPGERWREASLCVAGIDRATIDTLARRHAQNAVVVLAAHARLRIYRDDWRTRAGSDARLDFA